MLVSLHVHRHDIQGLAWPIRLKLPQQLWLSRNDPVFRSTKYSDGFVCSDLLWTFENYTTLTEKLWH